MQILDSNQLTLVPYLTNYRKAAQAKKAFLAGYYFIAKSDLTRPTYCTINNFLPGTIIEISYASNRCKTYITVPGVPAN